MSDNAILAAMRRMGIGNLIEHGETGYLCGPSTEELRDAIATLLADAPLRKRLGDNAREFSAREFSLDNIVQQELELYERVLAS